MKRLQLICLITFLGVTTTFAQRFCYVDTEYILSKMPAYETAQQTIDGYAKEWQAEIERRYEKIDKMYRDFQAEQVLLTEDMKRKKEEEIINKEKEVKEFQKQKFGYEGDLFQKRQELTKPFQDKVYNAIQKYATEKAYNFILDKNGSITLLFTDPKYDKSEDILEIIKESSK